jgi:hypothetical protein
MFESNESAMKSNLYTVSLKKLEKQFILKNTQWYLKNTGISTSNSKFWLEFYCLQLDMQL